MVCLALAHIFVSETVQLMFQQECVDPRDPILNVPSVSDCIRGKARVQHAVYGPDIHRNGGRDAPRPSHSALLEPVRTPFSSDAPNADNIPKEVLRIQGNSREYRAPARVSATNGAGWRRVGADRALLAGVHDVPRSALDRAYTCDGPVRHGHLLHLHVLHDVHR